MSLSPISSVSVLWIYYTFHPPLSPTTVIHHWQCRPRGQG